MAENQDGQEKTEDATGRRLEEARNRGQVAKSTDVTNAGILLLGGTSLYIFGQPMMDNFRSFMTMILHNSSSIQITDQNVIGYFYHLILFLAQMLLPIMSTIFVIALGSEIAQVGVHFAGKKFTEGLDFKKIVNPFSGLKKVFFSSRSIVELIKSFLKLLVLGGLAYSVLSSKKEAMIAVIEKPFMEIANMMIDVSFELLIKISLVYIFIAAGDYFYQKWKFKQEMKMTKQEIKEEGKQSEGDQQIKSRIRSLMRGRIRKLMMENVKTADVVITNPTHYAVALKYSPGSMNAPIVVAKGADFLAKRIRESAKENNITIVEDPPLARAIYFNVEVEDAIPENLFKAVAQVLAYVYQLRNNNAS